MKTSILSTQHFLTSKWSGGSSTQLYIFPKNATYVERNFDLRISTAKVEVAESSFTSLPGIHRQLMILEGRIKITHEGQYSKNLKAFDVDAFRGDWKTTSIGTCIDFNVMTKGLQQTQLYHLFKEAIHNHTFKPKKACKKLFLYATSGNIHMQLIKQSYILETGNLMVIEDLGDSSISIDSIVAFSLVVLEIY